MLISAGLLKIAPTVRVGGVWGDVCVIDMEEADKLSHVAAMSAPEHNPGNSGPCDNK